jgi:hypothetical protein
MGNYARRGQSQVGRRQSASRAARYIAESKIDPVREGRRRPLFSDKEDDLNDRTYRQANQ